MKAEITQKHFIETAKQMIHDFSIEELSVRKVSDKAGYAYKSLYNHFGSLDGLLWHVRKSIIDDISLYLDEKTPSMINSSLEVKNVFINYINYFLNHKNYYRFLFFHQLDRTSKSIKNVTEDENHMISMLCVFDYLGTEFAYSQSEITIVIQMLINISQGLLTTYVLGNDDLSREMVYKQFNDSVDFILRG
jgi:AcrR family transcriptional regulator